MDVSEQAPCLAFDDVLSPRERDIARCVALALSNDEIAARLSITLNTVRTHIANIHRKAGIRSRRELIAYAFRVGIV
jgi:DNA-binding CsgD family transcriptional regulator